MDKISAFMDGEAAPGEAQQALNRLRQDKGSLDEWNRFHLVGDMLRGERLLGDDFLDRLRTRLDAEPTVLAPRRRWTTVVATSLAIAASLAFVVMVSKVVMPERTTPQVEVAAAPAAAQVNDYLIAHHEFSPHSALQGVAPYVRSVSAPHDGNRR